MNNTTDTYQTLFAEIIVPVPLPGYFTYRIPRDLEHLVGVGRRVIIPFGPRKIYTGLIHTVHTTPPEKYKAKYIYEILDTEPVITGMQIKLLEWLKSYYMCAPGDVLNLILPSGLKLSTETKIQLNPLINFEELTLTIDQSLVIDALKENELISYEEVSGIVGKKGIYQLIKSLLDENYIFLIEAIKDKFIPKRIKKVRLNENYTDNKTLEQLVNELDKKPKQQEYILRYLQHKPVLQSPECNTSGLLKSIFTEGLSDSSLKTLIKNEVFEEFEVVVSRIGLDDEVKLLTPNIQLSNVQQNAFDNIVASFTDNKPALLHGITGSGKTEVFISLIQQAIENGMQVLYLLPEIAITTQIVQRLQAHFGNQLGVYHSKFSDNERVEIYKGVLNNRYPVVIGARSALFMPFQHLGLIIVDEEHDSSYKQTDPAPRYHARDAALMLAQMYKSNIILGSATPSVESYYLAKNGQWTYVEMNERFGNAVKPNFEIVNRKSDTKPGGLFTETFTRNIQEALDNKEQAIVFQNRRGFAPYLQCDDCEHIPTCNQCNVSLTYHQYSNELRCHYCGYTQSLGTNCSECGSKKLKTMGQGTERIEEDLKVMFPDADIQRMDADTTRKKDSFQKLINDFETGRTNILVGTQMIAKGLDFSNVAVVGIYDADRLLFYPDFRAMERAYQILVQVGGRAGRREKQGKVIVQTYQPQHPVFDAIINEKASDFYEKEIQERKQYNYPPFSRIIRVFIKHTERNECEKQAFILCQQLKRYIPENLVLGPEEPHINRIRNMFIREILVKIPRGGGKIHQLKETINNVINEVKHNKVFSKTHVYADVDPI